MERDEPSPLPGLATAWREAREIADAHRTRLQAAVRDALNAGVGPTEISRQTGISRVTLNL